MFSCQCHATAAADIFSEPSGRWTGKEIHFLSTLSSFKGWNDFQALKRAPEVRDDAEFFSVIKSNAFRTHFTTDGITLSGVVG